MLIMIFQVVYERYLAIHDRGNKVERRKSHPMNSAECEFSGRLYIFTKG